jgi:hypothetical protein
LALPVLQVSLLILDFLTGERDFPIVGPDEQSTLFAVVSPLSSCYLVTEYRTKRAVSSALCVGGIRPVFVNLSAEALTLPDYAVKSVHPLLGSVRESS